MPAVWATRTLGTLVHTCTHLHTPAHTHKHASTATPDTICRRTVRPRDACARAGAETAPTIDRARPAWCKQDEDGSRANRAGERHADERQEPPLPAQTSDSEAHVHTRRQEGESPAGPPRPTSRHLATPHGVTPSFRACAPPRPEDHRVGQSKGGQSERN
ncbi:unnamed protein product [Protopolystoma xenopodis]|uniref:Uncharacterized protein n=1 Tax=Protopolystoma xenopodis TaxID=117903 RepID=A0A3S5BAM4_9PLAT|nr:unnamed protein product [Protopolystoma xenopodis]